MSTNIFSPFLGTNTSLYSLTTTYTDTSFITSSAGKMTELTPGRVYNNFILINFKKPVVLDKISMTLFMDAGRLECYIDGVYFSALTANGTFSLNNKTIRTIEIRADLSSVPGYVSKRVRVTYFSVFAITTPCLLSIGDQLYTVKNDKITLISSNPDVSADFLKENLMEMSDLEKSITVDGVSTTIRKELNKMTDKYKVITLS